MLGGASRGGSIITKCSILDVAAALDPPLSKIILYFEDFSHKSLNIFRVNSYVIHVPKHSLKITDVIV